MLTLRLAAAASRHSENASNKPVAVPAVHAGGRHQCAKHRHFRRLRRTPSSSLHSQSKIVCLGLRARSTSRFCLPAKCAMPLRATDPIVFHRPERSHNLSFSYPPKKAVLTSPERKSPSDCSSRTRGELSLQNARKSQSQSLRSDRTSIAPGRACSARGSRKRHFCKMGKSTKNCAYASASPDHPTPSMPPSRIRYLAEDKLSETLHA